MSRLAPALLALLVAARPALAKKPPPPAAPPPEGIHLERTEGVTRLDAVLPGRLRGYAVPRRADGSRDLLLLVGASWPSSVKAPEKGPSEAAIPCDGSDPFETARTTPCRLLRLDPSGNGGIEVLRDDLPAEAAGLDSLDVDGDGAEELLVFLPGEIRVVRDAEGKRWGRGPEPLIADSSLGPGPAEPRSVRAADRAPGSLLPIATTDGLRTFGPLEDGRFGLVSVAPLPLSATLETNGIGLATPAVSEIGAGSEGSPVLAASGDREGGGEFRAERLRTVLIDPSVRPAGRVTECWSRLPSRERIHERFNRSIDGRPAMIVTTTPADKLKILGEKQLRLFFLEEDRTKAGKPPVLAADIGASLWATVVPVLRDVNGDGRTDLVVAYWKGLIKSAVGLEVFLRKEDGSFDASSGSTTIDVKDGDRSVLEFGHDLDGDGLPDLLILAGDQALIFPGVRPAPDGKGMVSSAQSFSVPFPDYAKGGGTITVEVGGDGMSARASREGGGIPRMIDLDGDGRPELLVAALLKDRRSVLSIFRLAQPPATTRK